MARFIVSKVFAADSIIRDGFFSQLDEADAIYPGSLVYCQSLHYLDLAIGNPNVSALITTSTLAAESIPDSKAVIVAADPRFMFFSLYADIFSKGFSQSEIEFGIGNDCRIHPSAVMSSKVRIGNRVEIGAGVVIEDFVDIMDDVFIGSNTVIGAEGLITLRQDDGSLLMVKHAGGVSIGRGTMILAGAVIAKSLFMKPTTIGSHCQIGIMANVGHGVSVGEQSVISGNTVIAGRVNLGPRVWVGASSSIAQGLSIGADAQIKMGSVVIGDVAPKAVVSGNFAMTHKSHLRNYFKIRSS
jgi:UDP-3-O-[3-hydroxymyristoyl] glucosamine N-acyltransferase